MTDVYLLNQWPCRMVELVAWVAGAENKDKTLLITGALSPHSTSYTVHYS